MIWNGKKEKSPAQNLSRIQQDSSASHALVLGKNNWSWLLTQQFFRWLVGWLVFSSNSPRPSWTPWKNSLFMEKLSFWTPSRHKNRNTLMRVPCPSQFHVRCSPPKKISAGYANVYTTEIDHENPEPIQIRNTNNLYRSDIIYQAEFEIIRWPSLTEKAARRPFGDSYPLLSIIPVTPSWDHYNSARFTQK